ncbi:MAG: DpnI domain-containing protein [Synergistes sp.]|nr:DpnI domain-containing protein [Synergistes sp.]
MNVSLDLSLATAYKNQAQIARVLTETWVLQNMFCPKCGNAHIHRFENNRPVADFYCKVCNSEFELKSKNGSFGHTIADGAYDTMISRISSNRNPDFMFMNYSMTPASVTDLLFIPKHFLTPAIIQKRRPLSSTARRAGWIGCNILFGKIPKQGQIPIVINGVAQRKEDTLRLVQRALLLQKNDMESRGWLFDVLNCVNEISNVDFTLNDIYQYEYSLQTLHPYNSNIRAKIRQQLQLLRDAGYIDFVKKGHYRKVD